MKIPPEDAYLKLKHTLEEINVLVAKHASMVGVSAPGLLSPALNNVFFASAEYSFMFSLESIAQKYKTRFK